MSESPSEWAMGEAKKIASQIFDTTGPLASFHAPLAKVISHALDAARKVPDGCVRLGATDHKLLGTLPTTADGRAVGHGSPVWRKPIVSGDSVYWDTGEELTEFFEYNGTFVALDYLSNSVGGLENHAVPISQCYSTREAAEAARKGTQ